MSVLLTQMTNTTAQTRQMPATTHPPMAAGSKPCTCAILRLDEVRQTVVQATGAAPFRWRHILDANSKLRIDLHNNCVGTHLHPWGQTEVGGNGTAATV